MKSTIRDRNERTLAVGGLTRRGGRILLAGLLVAGAAIATPSIAGQNENGRSAVATNNPSLLAQRQTRTKQVARTFPVDGRQIRVRGRSMDLTVERGDSPQATLEVDLEYWSSREEWMDLVDEEFDVQIDERASVVEIDTGRMPERNESWWRRIFGGNRQVSWALVAVLRVPAETALSIENRYGDVVVVDIGGPLEVDNSSGEVVVSGATDTSIANSYAPIDVDEVTGELRIRGSSSRVNVRGVQGPVDIETSYDSLTVERVEGTLRAVASSGTVSVSGVRDRAEVVNSYARAEVRDVGELRLRGSSSEVTVVNVRGPANIETSYAPLVVESVEGRLDVENPSGSVTVSDAGGDVTIRNSYAPVRVSDIRGALVVDSSSTAVSAQEIGGRVEISTSYAGVEVRGAGGALHIRNNSGRVEVGGLRGAALTADHTIETSYANVEFEWPDAGTLAIVAECTYGRIRSDFEGQLEERSSSRQRFTSEVDGGARLTVSATNGSIDLRRR